jgi:hypothetical protein
MLVLTRTDVETLLDLDQLVDALAAAHAELSADAAKLVPRVGVWSGSGVLGAMPGYAPSAGMGCKLVTLFARATATGRLIRRSSRLSHGAGGING